MVIHGSRSEALELPGGVIRQRGEWRGQRPSVCTVSWLSPSWSGRVIDCRSPRLVWAYVVCRPSRSATNRIPVLRLPFFAPCRPRRLRNPFPHLGLLHHPHQPGYCKIQRGGEKQNVSFPSFLPCGYYYDRKPLHGSSYYWLGTCGIISHLDVDRFCSLRIWTEGIRTPIAVRPNSRGIPLHSDKLHTISIRGGCTRMTFSRPFYSSSHCFWNFWIRSDSLSSRAISLSQ